MKVLEGCYPTYEVRLVGGDDFLLFRHAGPRLVEITEIVVNSQRRRGRGRAMVDDLIREAVPMGVSRIYAITRAENRVAQEFYEALNFRSIPLFDFYGVRTVDGDTTVDAIMYLRDLEQYP